MDDKSVPIDWINTLMALGEPEDSRAAWRVLKAWKEYLKEHQNERGVSEA